MPPTDPAEEKWKEVWMEADRGGFRSELHAILEAERRRLNEESEDRTFEAPLGRSDCKHGLYFEDVYDRAVEAARSVVEDE